jgi:uncharacterized protein
MPHHDMIGVISDTHGLIRPEVIGAFKGVGLILHAGDIGGLEVLEALREISPVRAIRGNNDRGDWARGLKETEVVDVDGIWLYLLHNVKELTVNPIGEGFKAVISGHSHRPSIEEKEGVLFINPGSAGPRRFNLPVSVGFIRVEKKRLKAEIRELAVSS